MKRIFMIVVYGFLGLCIAAPQAVSAEKTGIAALSKKALEAPSAPAMYEALSALKETYLSAEQHSEFVDFLRSLAAKKKSYHNVISYFIAAARYAQLLYLEDVQQWDEYFSMGNAYRDDITTEGRTAKEASSAEDPVSIYSRIVLWEFHNHQQDAFLEDARDELIKAAQTYASLPDTEAGALKAAADSLARNGERGRAKQIYRLYVDRIAAQGLAAGEIKDLAESFLADGNAELAQSLYDLYIEDLIKNKDAKQSASALLQVAGMFTYRPQGAYDMAYAEDVYRRAEELIGRDAFSEQVLYERALNLQAAGEYEAEKELLEDIVSLYPSSASGPEAQYKAGLLTAYAARDREGARKLFKTVVSVKSAKADRYQIASLYELGLLSQWEGRTEEAAAFYNELLKKADAAADSDLIGLAKQRLGEIEQGKAMEYNLKTFLDLTFLEEYSRFAMTRVTLSGEPKAITVDEQTTIEARPVLGPTGCFQVDVQYLWSGNLGNASAEVNNPQFVTSFASKGPRVVYVVVNAPTGFVDRNLILIEVQ